jgi:hypothetical protein
VSGGAAQRHWSPSWQFTQSPHTLLLSAVSFAPWGAVHTSRLQKQNCAPAASLEARAHNHPTAVLRPPQATAAVLVLRYALQLSLVGVGATTFQLTRPQFHVLVASVAFCQYRSTTHDPAAFAEAANRLFPDGYVTLTCELSFGGNNQRIVPQRLWARTACTNSRGPTRERSRKGTHARRFSRVQQDAVTVVASER